MPVSLTFSLFFARAFVLSSRLFYTRRKTNAIFSYKYAALETNPKGNFTLLSYDFTSLLYVCFHLKECVLFKNAYFL